MTSYPITLPATPSFAASNFGLRSNTTVFTSPLTNVQQVLSRPGQVWRADFDLPWMGLADAAAWRAALASLRGRQGTFLVGDPIYDNTPRGTAGGTPLVNGGSQTGNSLITDGWSNGATFLAGDYFSLGNYLHMLTADVTADGGGNATLVFEPTLRTSPSNNAALDISTPQAAMRLVDDESMWEERPGPHWGISFKAVEAL